MAADACGLAVEEVNGIRRTDRTLQVSDSCPSCKENRLNLHSGAFDRIADKNQGIADVSFDVVSCGITTPITLKNKEGTSRWL